MVALRSTMKVNCQLRTPTQAILAAPHAFPALCGCTLHHLFTDGAFVIPFISSEAIVYYL